MTWELILDGYSESSYSATPRFAAARLPWFAQHRPLDDKRYALDHFQTKLLKLPQTMQTARGKQLAQHNAQFLVEFMAKLSAELAGENEGVDHKVIDAFSPAG
ncbi:putative hydrolase domain protein [Escherichia coli]|nr:putative hydrolase domain protein [Escherichia coli]